MKFQKHSGALFTNINTFSSLNFKRPSFFGSSSVNVDTPNDVNELSNGIQIKVTSFRSNKFRQIPSAEPKIVI